MSQATKALPPVTTQAMRPVAKAVEQDGIVSRVFNGAFNLGKTVVWDLPKWSFANHPYVSVGTLLVGAYAFGRWKGWLTVPGETKTPPKSSVPPKPTEETKAALTEQMTALKKDEAQKKLEDGVTKIQGELDDLQRVDVNKLAQEKDKKVQAMKKTLEGVESEWSLFSQLEKAKQNSETGADIMNRKAAANKAYTEAQAEKVKTAVELVQEVAAKKVELHQAQGKVIEFENKVAILQAKIDSAKV
ncbi:MAG: hypothetical protein JSR58_06155 [Verrucomicrobia bacterium]|nr:hypothetical protein [Verrucomicrobiota bacterium]